DFYTVIRGDTLFAIALDFGFDYRELAKWNALADPSRILVGQRLRLTPPEGIDDAEVKPLAAGTDVVIESLPSATAAGPPEPIEPPPTVAKIPVLTEPRSVTLPWSDKNFVQLGGVSEKPVAVAPPEPAKTEPAKPVAASKAESSKNEPSRPEPPKPVAPVPEPPKTEAAKPSPPVVLAEKAADDGGFTWSWPAQGPLIYRYGESGHLKGVGIGGKSGTPVLAAATGKVVYAGAGLRGYGKLVIIKHSDTYLSVYAHNSTIVVKEGEVVKRGRKIAEMGDTDAARVALHFEIRRFGKPIDPLPQLPAGGSG
ncbi:MAG: peptidoglycan DD-metalloendopeptidase family protein, partial [Burkholderiales bacterium]|nr:peptidoglycan DD-metalloendopeptidase family protein [Burkholderiales bacterium]